MKSQGALGKRKHKTNLKQKRFETLCIEEEDYILNKKYRLKSSEMEHTAQ